MTTPSETSRWTTIRRNALGIIFIIVFAVGIFATGHFLWQLVRSIRVPHGAFGPVVTFFKDTLFGHLDGWVTAIATTALWVATVAIRRSSDRQAALDAPFLRLEMSLPGPQQEELAGIIQPDPTYYKPWRDEDLAHPELSLYVAHSVPEYVHLMIANEQQKPYGVAARVVVSALLIFPSVHNGEEVYLSRQITSEVIGANKYASGPIFNIGGLPWFGVRLIHVRYTDILQRTRQAAYGTGMFSRAIDGSVIMENTIYEPAKGELT